MKKENIKKFLNKKNLIIICSVLLFVLIIIILVEVFDKSGIDDNKPKPIDYSNVKYITVSDELSDDPDRIKISGKKMKKEQCYDNICISDVEILCYENIGTISYIIWNTETVAKDVYLKIKIGDFNGHILVDKLEPGDKYRGHIGYDGYDLRKTKSYKLQPMTDDEIKAIVK